MVELLAGGASIYALPFEILIASLRRQQKGRLEGVFLFLSLCPQRLHGEDRHRTGDEEREADQQTCFQRAADGGIALLAV